MQEQASDLFIFVCFFSLSQLSEPGRLGTALSGPAGWLASAMTFRRCDTSPTVDCCSFSICRTQSPEELGRVGERSLRSGWTASSLCARFENSVAILTFGCRWPRRRPRFHSKEKNLTFLSRNLSTVAPHLLKPFLNLQTSYFVKVLHVIRLREFWNDGKWFSHASCFFSLFVERS